MSIESILGIAHGFENPLAGRAVRTIEDVEVASSDVRLAWELGSSSVTNLFVLLEEKALDKVGPAGVYIELIEESKDKGI